MTSELHFFAIPALHAEAEQAALNAFIKQHRVVALEKQWVAAGLASHGGEGSPGNRLRAQHNGIEFQATA